MTQASGAFCPGERVRRPGAARGPLSGLRFAAKDLFDVAGHVTGAGNPDWERTHPPAATTAPVIDSLLEAGADLVGKTITDELAFSLEGRNAHYGTPINPAAPDRIPGGSSSGSASAVAAGHVDFALGTDTGGSVRVPAAFCGIYGIRPSHGAIPVEGVVPLAPSFDTVGWFARDPGLLERVGDVLLPPSASLDLGPLKLVEEALQVAEPGVTEAFLGILGRSGERPERIRLESASGISSEAWTDTMRVLQGYEIHRAHGEWIEKARPRFAPDIAARFRWAGNVPAEAAAEARPERELFARFLEELLADGTVLCLPTAPTEPPALDASREVFGEYRRRSFVVTAIAGLGRLPQVTLPAATKGLPVGVSLISARGTDRALLRLARRIRPRIRHES